MLTMGKANGRVTGKGGERERGWEREGKGKGRGKGRKEECKTLLFIP
jgi:hypothetical protein